MKFQINCPIKEIRIIANSPAKTNIEVISTLDITSTILLTLLFIRVLVNLKITLAMHAAMKHKAAIEIGIVSIIQTNGLKSHIC